MNLRKKLHIYLSLVPALLLTAASCRNQLKKNGDNSIAGHASDTLQWKMHNIIKKDAECDSTRDKSCVIANVSYPAFDGHPLLNDSVEHKLMSMIFTEKPDSSLEQQVSRFMDNYREFKKEPYANGRQYELLASAKILRQTPQLITLQADGYSYTGGAHGMSFTWYINYDRKNRKELKLEDVLRERFRDSLTSVAESIFRKNEGLPATGPLPQNQYFFSDNRFSLNDNYVFTPEGILFLYNPYEIKPYAAGKTKLLVPYSKISRFIKEGAVILSRKTG